MMPAAKQFDPILGVDIHIIQPPGPVPPVPIPHPHIGMVFDPMEFLPFLGASVMINGIPRGQAGSGGKALPPHFPIGGMFIKPPGNENEIFMGSATVLAEGEPFSHLAHPVLTCQDIGMPPPPRAKSSKVKSMMLPMGVVLPIPMGAPVLVGGPPTISMSTMIMKGVMAALGKGLKKLRKLQKGSKRWKRLSRRLRKKANKALDKLGVPANSRLRNKVSSGICTLTGHPVDVATGKVLTEAVDFELPGPLPLRWGRTWYSTSEYQGQLGHGWHHNYDLGLYLEKDVVVVRLGDGRYANFEPPLPEYPSWNGTEKMSLHVGPKGYILESLSGLHYHFGHGAEALKEMPLQALEDRNGNRIVFERLEGKLSAIVDSAGRRILMKTDKAGRITAIGLPDPEAPGQYRSRVEYRYSEEGDLVEVRDALGNPFQYVYDNHLLVKETNRGGRSFYFQYDGHGAKAWCVRTWGDGGVYDHKLVYDREKRVTEVTDSRGFVSRFYYNEDGVVLREVDAEGAETLYEYEEQNKTAETDALGNTTRFEHDHRGRLTAVIAADGQVTTLEYAHDWDENPIRLTDAGGNTWRRGYDRAGNAVLATDPLGQSSQTQYDTRGLPLRFIDPTGNIQELAWDGRGQLTAWRDALGNVTRYEYDVLGRITTVTDPAGHVSRYRYDTLDQVTEVIQPDGGKLRLQYNAQGNLSAFTDAAGRTTRYEYDGLSQPARRIEPDGRVLRYAYDTERNLTGLLNENNERYDLVYDHKERLVAERGFDGRVQRYQYDPAGRLVRHLDSSQWSEFVRDPAGRLLEKTSSDGRKSQYAYDKLGRLKSAKNDDALLTFKFDVLGRLIEEQQSGATLKHSYDALGRRTGTTLPDGKNLAYGFDANGNFTQASLDETPLVNIERDARGQEAARRLSNALTTWSEYDPMGRLLSRRTDKEHRPLIKRGYRYNAAGNLTQIEDLRKGHIVFRYDALDRLQSITNAENELFAFDPAGNLVDAEQAEQKGYVKGNRLRVFQDYRFDYDERGNLIKERKGKRETLYHYNADNQLIKAEREGQSFEYAYDPFGRRIAKKDAFGETKFLWDGDVLLQESRKSLKTTYVHEPYTYEPLCQVKDGEVYHYHLDHLGTPQELTDAKGELVWSVKYRAYGSVLAYEIEEVENNLRFPGQYYDGETGLHYNRNRYYHPAIGRFIHQDPIGLLGGLNNYEYAPNPVNWMDPLGLAAGKKCGPTLNPNDVNFSQRTVSGNVENYVEDMKADKWDWGKSGPIRVLEQDGKWVSYDNRRLMAAQQAGLTEIPVEVVNPSDIMPGSKSTWGSKFESRFNDKRNVRNGGRVPRGGVAEQPKIL